MIGGTTHFAAPQSAPPAQPAAWIAITLVVLAGCSPSPPDTARTQISVDAPIGDPGQLSEGPIAPPYLTDIDARSARGVATPLGDATQLVQRRGDDEDVPTPKPAADSGPKPDSEEDMFPGGVAGPEDYRTWPVPQLTLVVTGQQHGYIEPCGCTGLDKQKGGVARRFTFLAGLREKGWTLLPLEAGDQVRRFGRQAEVKLQQSVKALKAMDYQAVGFGPDDLRLGVGELLSVAAGDSAEDTMFVSANVVLIDPSLMPQTKVIEKNGRKIGITSILDPDLRPIAPNAEILIDNKVDAARKAIGELKAASPDFNVLLFFGKEKSGMQLMQDVPGFDLIVAAGGYGEPTYRAESIEGSDAKMIVTGNKGMYAGLVGIYPDQPFKYARVPLTHEFGDAPEMRQLMADYQEQLKAIGLGGLGLLPPVPHASGQKFVGTARCGECHKSAYGVWKNSKHALATEHIIKPPQERGDIARHFDPECLSCHVTGWNPEEYFPYASGYLSLEETEHMTGSGCENCHGPGSEHSAAEAAGSGASQELLDQLREAIRLPLDKARDRCMSCHDLDNSPDFHEKGAFEEIYWPDVEHYGVD